MIADHLTEAKTCMRACDRALERGDEREFEARDLLHDAEECVIEGERALAAAIASITAKAEENEKLEREQMARGVSRWQDIYNGRAAGLRLALEMLQAHQQGEKGGEA